MRNIWSWCSFPIIYFTHYLDHADKNLDIYICFIWSVLNFKLLPSTYSLLWQSLTTTVSCATIRDCTSFISTYKRVSGHGFILASGTYLSPYNVLNFPAGVVRMTSVTEEDDDMMSSYPDHDMWHKRVIEVMAPISLFQWWLERNFTRLIKWENWSAQNKNKKLKCRWSSCFEWTFCVILQAMKGSVGLPVRVQVVAPWYEDEMCLRVMKEVEGAADFHVMDK